MNEEAVKQAKDRLRRIVKTSKETAYDLVYSEIDIKSTEILLDYIEELEKIPILLSRYVDKQVLREEVKPIIEFLEDLGYESWADKLSKLSEENK